MSERNSPKQSSSSQGSASEEYLKIVEQLIDSDDDETLLKKMAQLHPAFPILTRLNASLSNQQKIILFLRDSNFANRVTLKLREKNVLQWDPVVKLQLYTIRHGGPISQELDQQDIHQILCKFGNVVQLVLARTTAYARFDNYVSAFLVIKAINGFAVNDTLKLAVTWCDAPDFNYLHQQQQQVGVAGLSGYDGQEPRKIVGRYDIFMEVNSEFKLSSRIIGPRGSNMKKILSQVLMKSKLQHLPIQSIAKIRLRGKGSAFLEGHTNTESDQLLHLCISSKNAQIFKLLCQQVQKLLNRISLQYKQYYYKLHKKMCEGIAYRKYEFSKNSYEMVKQLNLEQINDTLDFIAPQPTARGKIKENEVVRLITQRDKARKQGNFKEADQIREKLKREGVLLVDEKHANGKSCKTTWKYMDE